jgi:hypothetical protein
MRWLCVVPFMLLSANAFAQQGLPAQVYACANLADAVQRHACFDALVPELRKAGGSAIVAKPTPSPLTAPVLSPAEAKSAKAGRDTSVDRISVAVKSIATGLDGKYRFTMENGQVWKQLDTVKLRNLGAGPWSAEIRKAALGSFLLTVGRSQAVRVERMN